MLHSTGYCVCAVFHVRTISDPTNRHEERRTGDVVFKRPHWELRKHPATRGHPQDTWIAIGWVDARDRIERKRLRTKELAEREGFESALKRKLNNMQRHGWPFSAWKAA